jgi:phage protein U
MIGYFGDIIFETSDTKILNFTGFKVDTAARYASHEIINKKPVTEYLGPGLLAISFTVSLNGNHGVKPRAEMELWRSKAENGEAEILVIGGKPLGDNRWVVKSVSEAWETVFAGGELFAGKIEVALEEYVVEVIT